MRLLSRHGWDARLGVACICRADYWGLKPRHKPFARNIFSVSGGFKPCGL